MTEHERELGAFIVGEVSAQLDRLEARFERHEEREATQYAALSAKVDAVHTDQSKLRREVQRRLADAVTEDEVKELASGQYQAIELETVKAALAKKEAEEARAKDAAKAIRGKIGLAVLSAVLGLASALVGGYILGRVHQTAPAAASTMERVPHARYLTPPASAATR